MKKPFLITPCVKICRLQNGYCIGCKRSEEELSNWFWYTEEKRLQIMEELNMRVIN
jgi:predicted Fe-S protein YdhL (DUF1289 family)